MIMRNAIQKAADSVGSITKLARYLGIQPQAIHQWRKTPAERVLEVERHSGVSRHELRPDLYPIEGDSNEVGPRN